MASTLSPQSVVVKITEEIVDDCATIGHNEIVITFPTISIYDKGAKTISTTQQSLFGFVASGTPTSLGTYIDSSVKYLRITNEDDTNFIRLGCTDSGGDTYYVKILPGGSAVFTSLHFDANSAGGAFGAYVYPDQINIAADTAACDISWLLVIG